MPLSTGGPRSVRQQGHDQEKENGGARASNGHGQTGETGRAAAAMRTALTGPSARLPVAAVGGPSPSANASIAAQLCLATSP